jgi:hypothetical protein
MQDKLKASGGSEPFYKKVPTPPKIFHYRFFYYLIFFVFFVPSWFTKSDGEFRMPQVILILNFFAAD